MPRAAVRGWVEPALGALVTLVGVGMTSYAALNHVGPLLAPGSALVLGGSVWLGNLAARRDVRILPGAQPRRAASGEPS